MTGDELRKRCLEIATAEIGVKEIPGNEDNPRIVEYNQCTMLKATDDETPWCSAFCNWVLKQLGIEGTGSARARVWLYWGREVEIPVPGCIVVLRRGNPPAGHVGFFVRKAPGGLIKVLGGNQNDCVKVSSYKEADVLGYHWLRES
jgi:uncharacterized protein (TIGR02594 family)